MGTVLANSAQTETGVARANRYTKDILSGKIPACTFVKQACTRQRDDLKRKKWKYHFDEAAANRIVDFIERLPHVKGRQFAGKKLVLADWQCFLMTTVFGWLNKDGLRRFRTVYVEVPRKNGKSTVTAPVGLYLLAADGEPGAEVYSAATTRDQAKIVWNDARSMVLRTGALQRQLGVAASVHSIYIQHNNSVFKPLSRDHQGNLDGLNVHCALIDELHGHKDRGLWDVLETGTGARAQPLLWAITTAGSNKTGICYEQRTYATKILSKTILDETYFGIIYTIDEKDDPMSPDSWRKANPNYGVSVSPEDLERKAHKAQQMAAAMSNFLTKHLNVWVNADSPWMNMTSWNACYEDTAIEDFSGEDCVVGCDLATKTDIAAKINLFEREHEDGKTHYYVFGKFWIPEQTVETSNNSLYAGWVRDGWLTEVPGGATDFSIIEDDVREDCEDYRVVDAVFDPWQAAQMIQNLSADGLPAAEYRQTVQNMSPAMKELEALVITKRIHHDGNPVLAWMLSNVVAHYDAKENIYPRKEQKSDKIDGAVALIMTVGRSMLQNDDDGEFDGFLTAPVA